MQRGSSDQSLESLRIPLALSIVTAYRAMTHSIAELPLTTG
ncbi:hypothetical protein EDC35_10462 [Thiobaca trueperi]|uniref:Uncharacterized protein n=2 Tax=Thiobaca trueperi TaxID=127458 RepID=A0A4R3N3F8_9GAMM|nr:hypothetical protein EDC35_10462 [Thiobaca trueperi]